MQTKFTILRFQIPLIFLFSMLLVNCEDKNQSERKSDKKSLSTNSPANPLITKTKLSASNGCGFNSNIKDRNYFLFSSNNEATAAIKRIMKVTGLPQNFDIEAADVDNAAAIIVDKNNPPKRYILYNETFFENIQKQTSTPYAPISILAHEIGHHLAGHTLNKGGSSPLLELEADRFSGFTLRKLGASLENSQAAVNLVCPDNGTETHPCKTARRAAIANGWKDADDQLGSTTSANTKKNILPDQNDYVINIKDGYVLVLRDRELNARELGIANSSNKDEKDVLDANTLKAILNNGCAIKVVEEKKKFYKIQTIINNQIVEGYIAKRISNIATIVKNQESKSK